MMNTHSPMPTVDQVAALCTSEYGLGLGDRLSRQISRLPGENNNYQIVTADGQRYVLKLAGDDFPSALLELEHLAIDRALASGVSLDLPRIIPTRAGHIMANSRAADGTLLRARLLEFVPGTPWCEAVASERQGASLRRGTPGPQQFRDLGRALAALDLALSEIEHPAAHRTHRWDLTAAAQHRGKITLVGDPAQRRIVESMFHIYAACAVPQLAHLPHALIHGDANDENVLLQDGRTVVQDVARLLTHASRWRPATQVLRTGHQVDTDFRR